MLIYYCYSCNEYFKVSDKKAKTSNNILCPHCTSFDTEFAPEEECSQSENDTDCDDDTAPDTEYDSYINDVENDDRN